VTGPGGAGKTRVALQAAADLLEDFGDGAFFVGLAGIADPSLVIPTIAQTLGVTETGGQTIGEALRRFLKDKELLLVLDNLEHLLDAAPQISDLILEARSVKTILSSRAPLRVSGEQEYPIPELADHDAVALFSERARAIKPDFRLNGDAPIVAQICRRLDGLPLAIELAAARAKVLTPRAVLERLDHRLPLLTGGARDVPHRQRTLRDTITWSYELLDETEQRQIARVAVFVGGFTLEAAEQVCEADLDSLASLVEKSLLRHGEDGFRMLETIREFALERLEESREREHVARRFVDFFLALAGREGAEVEREASVRLARLDAEHDNFRAALQFARELDDPRLELRLASALGDFWEYRSYLREGLDRMCEALDRDPGAPAEIRGPALQRGTMMAIKLGDFDTARRMAEETGQLHAGRGDERGVGHSLHLLGIIAMEEGRYDDSRALLEQGKSIRERVGDESEVHASFHNLGLLAMTQKDYERARAELESALGIAEEYGMEQQIANSLCDLAFAELSDERLGQARMRFGQALERATRLGWTENVAYCLAGLAAVAVDADELDLAGRLLGQVDRLLEDIHLKLELYADSVRNQVELELRSRLGDERLEALHAEGRSLSTEDAVSAALASLD
jgi:predicted ATPase